MDSQRAIAWMRQKIARSAADTRAIAALLTRLPLGGPEPDLPRALAAMPFAGAAIGAIGGLVLAGCLAAGLAPLAAAVAAVAALVWLTGALHEDGLADTADGLGGDRTRDDKLAIMRDSRIGAYGVVALILALGARIALVAEIADEAGALSAVLALAAAGGLSRAGAVHALWALPPARDDGLGHMAGRPDRPILVRTVVTALGVAAVLLLPWLGLVAFVAALVGTVIAITIVERMGDRQIGGQTGDLCGALQQGAEVLSLAGIAVATG